LLRRIPKAYLDNYPNKIGLMTSANIYGILKTNTTENTELTSLKVDRVENLLGAENSIASLQKKRLS